MLLHDYEDSRTFSAIERTAEHQTRFLNIYKQTRQNV